MEYFLREDIDALDRKIVKTREMISEALREIGDSCQQGSETSHDNPGFEEGQRAVTMWSRQLRSLTKLRGDALIISPPAPSLGGKIRIGHVVTIKDLATKEERDYQIGSAMVFDNTGKRISYKSPAGEVLLGAMIGDVLDLAIGDQRKKLLVLDVK